MRGAARWSPAGAPGRAGNAGARAGILSLSHGAVETPAFMPVGTRGAVRGLDAADLSVAGAQMVLANTYHLMLRPGEEVVGELGGIHRFMGWDGPILTDSGGYQIFSLGPHVDEAGATFRSTYDGSEVRLTPEDSVRIQERLGPDVAMVLDVLVGLPNDEPVVRAAMERTLRWSERAIAVHRREDQALFGIVQGGVDPGLRAASARATADLGFPGFGIGGLAVGETVEERNAALEAAFPELPSGAVRYVMGLGDPEGVLDAVARGADLFDCVWPTRLARHGRVFTSRGDFNLRRAEHARDAGPLADDCPCHACSTVSRAYLRHLLMTNELTVFRLLSLHNLTYTLGLLADARSAILAGGFERYRRQVTELRATGPGTRR